MSELSDIMDYHAEHGVENFSVVALDEKLPAIVEYIKSKNSGYYNEFLNEALADCNIADAVIAAMDDSSKIQDMTEVIFQAIADYVNEELNERLQEAINRRWEGMGDSEILFWEMRARRAA